MFSFFGRSGLSSCSGRLELTRAESHQSHEVRFLLRLQLCTFFIVVMRVLLSILLVVFAFEGAGRVLALESHDARVAPVVTTTTMIASPNIDFCTTCISFGQSSIQELINIILNVGVVGSCTKLCQALAEKVGSQIVGVGCTILCGFVGVREFVKLVQKADLDPFYLCELLRICPTFDGGDAELVNVTVTPREGPQGTQFRVNVKFATVNGTGIGETMIDVHTVDKLPIGGSQMTTAQKPGTYAFAWNVKAQPDPNCDPTQGFCEKWLPGNYTADVSLCYGECGSKHPHSQVYFEGTGSFAITEK